MPNTSTHSRVSVLIADHVTHLLGVTTTSTKSFGAISTSTRPVVSVTSATGANHIVQLQSYSYDGVIHKESYVSDI